MEKKYTCNNCKRRYYSLGAVTNCICKLKRKVNWKAPSSRTSKNVREIINWTFFRNRKK